MFSGVGWSKELDGEAGSHGVEERQAGVTPSRWAGRQQLVRRYEVAPSPDVEPNAET